MTDKTAVVDAQIETIKDADALGETPFSKLFHDARTTSRRRATGVTVQVRVSDDGAFEVHKTPVKTRRGEHLRGTDAWDGRVSLPVKPFMETENARETIIRQLRDIKRSYIAMQEAEQRRQRLHPEA